MNIHKNARLTFARRLEMVQDVLERKLRPTAIAARHDVSVPTVRKWVGRYLAQGEAGLYGVAVPEIPLTVTGKVSEIAVHSAIHGRAVSNRDALANPEALLHFAPERLLEIAR